MSHDDANAGQPKSLANSSSLLASSYDAYIGGMSSDSELITSGSGLRHGHHYYHQRPYTSQSRVYYAHPVPRNSPASSRLAHYYDPMSAAGTQSTSSTSLIQAPQSSSSRYSSDTPTTSLQHQSVHQQHHLQHQSFPNDPIDSSITKTSTVLGHQASVSSSGSASSAYLTDAIANESQISPIVMQQQQQQQRPKTSSGRQLPQRPFKQSMSIDQSHSYGSSHYSSQLSDHTSPVHLNQSHMGTPSRGTVIDQSSMVNQYIPQKAHQSRNLSRDLDSLDNQAARMNLYDDNDHHHHQHQQYQQQQPLVVGLPPSGVIHRGTSSSSTSRQLPVMSQHQQHKQLQSQQQAQGLMASMSIDQAHQQILTDSSYNKAHPYQSQQHHHHPQLHHQPTDPYPSQRQPTSSAMHDWLSPLGLSSSFTRQSGQFKQTMSIDQYQGSSSSRHPHFSQSANPHLTDEQYNQQSYANSPSQHAHMMTGYESEPHTSKQQSYYAPVSQENKYYQQHQPIESSVHRNQKDYNVPNKGFDRASSGGSSAPASSSLPVQKSQPTSDQVVRTKQVQHQVSDSSSNSNLSGSFKFSQLDSNILDKQTANSEHQKSKSGSSSHFQHQLPQQKISTSNAGGGNQQHYSKQEALRRGHTSATMMGAGYNDLGGSQSALSESGDLSSSQASCITGKRHNMRAASPSLGYEGSHSHHHHHGASSSSHTATQPGMRSESTTGLPNGSGSNSTLTKKSNSATQLSMTGTKKRLGFRKKQLTSFSVHRSEEVAPLEARHLVKQGSSVSEGDSSMSGDSSSRSWSNSNFKQQTSEELASMSFIDGLGKGQMISRQGLTSPYLGDIQLSLCDRRGNLEVEVIRARNLVAKSNKIQPLTYVKLYLVKNRKCLAKAKTTLSNKRTLNPLFQQQLTFHEDYHGCILQSIVWGNFGKMDKKNFMGIAQISIDDLELSDTVISWYKLFLPSSLQTLPSKSLRHTLLSNSTESFTNTNNS